MKHLKKLFILVLPVLFFTVGETQAQTKGTRPAGMTRADLKSFDTNLSAFTWIVRNLPAEVQAEAIANYSTLTFSQKEALVNFAVGMEHFDENDVNKANFMTSFHNWVKANMSSATYEKFPYKEVAPSSF